MANDVRGIEEDGGSVGYVYVLACVAALSGLLFGYDTAVINGAIGYLTQYFKLDVDLQQGWAAASVLLGCAAGTALAGFLSDWLGRKRMLALAGLMFFASALGTALPNTIGVFVVFRLLAGLAIGAASVAAPVYIAEVAPARMRGRMVSINQLAIVTGILLAYFVNYFIAYYGETRGADWNLLHGWRWMFGAAAVPSVFFLLLLITVPESPRWLTQRGRLAEAERVLARVNGPAQARVELAVIEKTIAEESGSLSQLLLPGLRIALMIGVVLAVLQQITGINAFLYFGSEIFKKIGWSENAALMQQVLIGGFNLIFTLLAIRTVDRWGRRPLMILGPSGMGVALLGMAAAAYWGQTGAGDWSTGAAVLMLAFMLTYIASFALSIGPVVWVLLAEMFPTQIRGRAMALCTVCLWLADFVVTLSFPIMANNEFLVTTFRRSFPFLVYATFCAVMVAFVAKYVPETKGRTLEEIERSWTKR